MGAKQTKLSKEEEEFSTKKLEKINLINGKGTSLEILNFGATVFSLKLLNKGKFVNVVVGPKNPKDYLSAHYQKKGKFFGASVGRYAGRISGGMITIAGKDHLLHNKEGVHLHGGEKGFSYKFWKVETCTEGPDPMVEFSYLSKDNEEGYPGDLQVWVKYRLTEKDEVEVEYRAVSNKTTVVNLTNHTYFNLNGEGSVKDHELRLGADLFLEVDEKLLPTGKFSEVKGSEKDFRQIRRLNNISLDDTFVLRRNEEVIRLVGRSGISLGVKTNQPGVVIYTPEDLPEDWNYQTRISSNKPAICLETQNFPDAPHHSNFPSAVINPGEEYRNSTCWRFETT